VPVDGGRVAGRRLLARLVVEGITTGKVTFPGEDKSSVLGVKDWIEFVKWAYQYLEPPTTKIDTGESLLKVIVEYSNGQDTTADVPPVADGNTQPSEQV